MIKKIFTLGIFVAILSNAGLVFAAHMQLCTINLPLYQGDQFSVGVTLDSEESVNAFEGTLRYPHDLLELKAIRDGVSVVNFWIEEPHLDEFGDITFSGMTPGGVSGAGNQLFSVVFQAKQTGVASLTLSKSSVLQNDGLGTPSDLSVQGADVSIGAPVPGLAVRQDIIKDTEAPEDFTPILKQSDGMFDGKYFLVFATQDKISGIDHYEVREGSFGWFNTSESPYVIKNQTLKTKVHIKAIDKMGNTRIVVVNLGYEKPWYDTYSVWVVLIIVIIVWFLYKKRWLKFI